LTTPGTMNPVRRLRRPKAASVEVVPRCREILDLQ
jgi:hypothetical protein